MQWPVQMVSPYYFSLPLSRRPLSPLFCIWLFSLRLCSLQESSKSPDVTSWSTCSFGLFIYFRGKLDLSWGLSSTLLAMLVLNLTGVCPRESGYHEVNKRALDTGGNSQETLIWNWPEIMELSKEEPLLVRIATCRIFTRFSPLSSATDVSVYIRSPPPPPCPLYNLPLLSSRVLFFFLQWYSSLLLPVSIIGLPFFFPPSLVVCLLEE